MRFKSLILFIIGTILVIFLTEFFYPGEILALSAANYSDVLFPLSLIFGGIESILTIRGVELLTFPVAGIPLLSDLAVVIPEYNFVLSWVITGLIVGLISRNIRSGGVVSGFLSIILVLIFMLVGYILQPNFIASLDIVGQISLGFQLGGPVVWAAFFAAISGTIGGRITRPPKIKDVMVDMSEIEPIANVCKDCGYVMRSNAEFCVECGSTCGLVVEKVEDPYML